ncbi:hypothetical protein [Psychrobacter sp. ASPA161_6]|uniref:hypothetical protein n=1 Tax=Psychrobacter sp. ASPA161_6 TaxID=3160962 RepID=UPI003F7DC59B
MSIYLVVLPKIESNNSHLESLLKKVAVGYSELFSDIDYKYHLYMPDNPYKSGSLIVWDRIDPASFFHKNSNGVWAISSSTNVSKNIAEQTTRRGGELQYLKPIWGHYTVTRAELYLSQFQAWNTVPAIESIHYAEDDNYIYVSNRPLPIALAMSKGVIKDVIFNTDFLAEYLAFGYSITGNTTYKGVKILHPNKMLNVIRGHISFKDAPLFIESTLPVEHTQEEARQHLKLALENAMKRSISNMRGRKIQLRMSGGKDSRLCALLAQPYKSKFFAVNFGKMEEEETDLSAIICNYVNIPLEITSPKLISGNSIKEKVENLLMLSDGILPSEPHTAIYVGSEPRTDNESIMMGQWPLFKGGYANSMKNDEKVLKEKLTSIIYPIFEKTHYDYFQNYILDWMNQTSASSNLEKLYLFSRTFRSGRWLQSNVALLSRDADVLYPISDAEVTAVSDALTMFEKVSQSALYSVMDSMDNYITHLPLANSRWPAGTSASIGDKLNDATIEDLSKNLEIPPKYVTREYISAMSDKTIFELAKQIQNSIRLKDYKEILSCDFIEAVSKSALGTIQPPSNMHLRNFKSAIWRLFIADVWLSENWLK